MTAPEHIEDIDARVFQIVRANQHLSLKAILLLLKDDLPELSPKQIGESLDRLAGS